MFGGNFFEKNKNVATPEAEPEQEQLEPVIEKEIEDEILNLENNLEGFKDDIENMGGEEALQKELENNELLANRWKNKYNRTKNLITSISLAIPTAVLGVADYNALPQINWDLPADQQLGGALIAFTVIGAIGTITTFLDFLKNQRKVHDANHLMSY